MTDATYTVTRELIEFEDETLPEWVRSGGSRFPFGGDPEMGLVERVDVDLILHGGLELSCTVHVGDVDDARPQMVARYTVSRVRYSVMLGAMARYPDTFGTQRGHGSVCVLDFQMYDENDRVISRPYETTRAVVRVMPRLPLPVACLYPLRQIESQVAGQPWSVSCDCAEMTLAEVLGDALYRTAKARPDQNVEGYGYWLTDTGDIGVSRHEMLAGGVETVHTGTLHDVRVRTPPPSWTTTLTNSAQLTTVATQTAQSRKYRLSRPGEK